MAEGDGALYNFCKGEILTGNVDLVSDTIKVALVTGYTPLIDSHDKWASISASEESGSGYSAGGKSLASGAVSVVDASDLAKFDGNDVTWSSLSVGTPSHAIMYDTTHASSILLAYWELSTASNGGDYTLQWSSSGIMTLA